jgi:hypothetical protein
VKQPYWYNIIFSDDRSIRWKRHFLFWLVVFFYHLLRIGIMMPAVNTWDSMFLLFRYAIMNAMIINPFLTYSIAYFLIPKYFNRKKYFVFSGGMLLVILLILFYYFIINLFNLNSAVRNAIGLSNGLLITTFKPGFIRAFGNPPLITGLFLSLKILKNWRLEQSKTETLAKENASAELQLLKAQIHPHFLFNTLNNIYSFSLYRSPQAGALVKKLSGMLGYMINECNEKLVPLDKEIALIQDYMGLEKVRYGKRLTMDVEIHGDFENKFIAPLLMIPFIENSFKHGTSQMLRQPWIKLEITTVDAHFFFKLSNSRPSLVQASKTNKGIGLLNVKKRLQLLYPDNHQLNIESSEDTFMVQMQIMLKEQGVVKGKIIDVAYHKPMYA